MARIKGTGMAQVVRDVKAKPEARRLVPPHLQHYLADGERISVAEWYSEADHMGLLRVLVAAAGSPADIWGTIGAVAARTDLTGVYRSLLRPGDPAATAQKAPVLWSSYHDTGRMIVTPEGRGTARYVLTDYGYPTKEMCAITTGYTRSVLELAGARDVEVAHVECVNEGATRCLWQSKWEEPE